MKRTAKRTPRRRRGGRQLRALEAELHMTRRTLRETQEENQELELLNQKLAIRNARLEMEISQIRQRA